MSICVIEYMFLCESVLVQLFFCGLFFASVVVEMAATVCAICQLAIEHPEMPWTELPCHHTSHVLCLKSQVEVLDQPLEELACAVCGQCPRSLDASWVLKEIERFPQAEEGASAPDAHGASVPEAQVEDKEDEKEESDKEGEKEEAKEDEKEVVDKEAKEEVLEKVVAVVSAPAPASGGADALLDAALAHAEKANLVECCICLRQVPALETKKLAKGRQECKACQRVDLAINRKVGSTQWLRNLDSQSQADFYLAAHTLPPSKMVDLVATHTVSFSRKSSSSSAVEKKFLPISVWETQGFKVDLAKISPEDKKEDSILGTLVRLHLESTKEEKTRTVEQTMQILAQQKRQSRGKVTSSNASLSAFEDQPMLGDVDLEDESEEDCASSSSSSSEQAKKKKKSSRKSSKKTKKAKVSDAGAKKAAKELAARQKKAARDAAKLSEGIKKNPVLAHEFRCHFCPSCHPGSDPRRSYGGGEVPGTAHIF